MSEPHPVAESAKDIARAWGNRAWQIAISHKPLDDRDMRQFLLEGKEAVRNLLNADFVVAADELITLRARLSRLSALLDEAEAALAMFSIQRFSDNEVLMRIDLPDKRSVQFRGGDGFFGNAVFFEATRLAASVAAKIAKEKSDEA